MSRLIPSVLLLAGAYGPVFAQEQPPPVIMEAPAPSDTVHTQIIGGEPLIAAHWPATLKYYFVGADKQTYTCTSTIIGEKVLVTAAHCIGAGKIAEVRLPFGSSKVLCDHYPEYDGNVIGDVALCRTLDNGPFKANFPFENIDLSGSRVRKGASIFLAGYGCRTVDQELSGTLYGGFGKVQYVAKSDNEHHLSREGVTICPGDSGGGAYALEDVSNLKGKRYFVAINSAWTKMTLTSHLAPLHTSQIVAFVKSWAKERGLKICGVDADARNCRS